MNKKITVTGANKVFFAFVILFIGFQIVLTVISVLLMVRLGPEYGENLLTDHMYELLLINQYVLILAPVLFYVIVNKLDFKEVFRIKSPGLFPAIVIALLAIPAQFTASALNTIVVYLLQFVGNIPPQAIPVPENTTGLIVSLLVIAVSPAICEEMLHRGILLSAYERRGSIRAVFITAIFFGIFHFDITNLLGTVFLGLLLAYYVIRTNSIFAGVLAHFLNNAIAILMQYFLWRDVPIGETLISSNDLFVSILYGIISAFLIAVLLKLFNFATRKRARLIRAISSRRNDFISVISHWPIIVIISLYFVLMIMTIMTYIITKITPIQY